MSSEWSTCANVGGEVYRDDLDGKVRMLALPLACYFRTSYDFEVDCPDGRTTVDNEFEYTQSIKSDLDMTVERPRFSLTTGRDLMVGVSVCLPEGTRRRRKREKRYAERFIKNATCRIPVAFGEENQITIKITMKEGDFAWSTHVWSIKHDSREPNIPSSFESQEPSSDDSSSS